MQFRKTFTVTGMLDHDAVSFEILTNLGKQYLQPRKIFQYHKADKNSITTEVNKLLKTFFQQDPYQRTVHDNWTLFKTKIMEIVVDDSYLNNHKRFWSLIKHMRKDYSV